MSLDRTRQFGKIPYDWVESGRLRELKRSEALVAFSILAHVNGKTWSAALSYARIIQVTDLSKSTVVRAVNRLVTLRFIRKKPGAGRGEVNRYLVEELSQISSDASEEAGDSLGESDGSKGVSIESTQRTGNGVKTQPQVCHLDAENVASEPAKRVTQGESHTEAHAQQSNSTHADAAVRCHSPQSVRSTVEIQLGLAGIEGAPAEHLAKDPDVDAQMVREERESAKRQGKGTGVIIRNLQTRAAAKREERLARESHARCEEQRRQNERVKHEQCVEELKEIRRRVSALDDPTFQRLLLKAVEQKPYLKQFLDCNDQRDCRFIQVEICAILDDTPPS